MREVNEVGVGGGCCGFGVVGLGIGLGWGWGWVGEERRLGR